MGGVDTSTQKKRQQTEAGTIRSIEKEGEKGNVDMGWIATDKKRTSVDLSIIAMGKEIQRRSIRKNLKVNQIQ